VTQTLDIKNAEKQVFRLATFEDGIWEIYLGWFFILMSFYDLTRELLGPVLNGVLFLGLPIILALLALAAKKRIVQPRLGLVKLGASTQKKIKAANLITIGLVLATFTLMIMGATSLFNQPAWERFPQWFNEFGVDLIFALIIVAIFCLIAYFTSIARFYVHGLLLGLGNFFTVVLKARTDTQFGWPLTLSSLVILLIGVFVLAKFIQSYPLPAEEASNG
jgi:hypothetical protein